MCAASRSQPRNLIASSVTARAWTRECSDRAGETSSFLKLTGVLLVTFCVPWIRITFDKAVRPAAQPDRDQLFAAPMLVPLAQKSQDLRAARLRACRRLLLRTICVRRHARYGLGPSAQEEGAPVEETPPRLLKRP